MTILFGGSGVGGVLAIKRQYIFLTVTDRDDYFITNPSELLEKLYVSANSDLYQWQSGSWVTITPIIVGPAGSDAHTMRVEYSFDGLSGWTATLNTALHKYWRWSIDNGVSWIPTSPSKARYSAADAASGIPAPYSMQVGANGKLQILKDTTVIQEQDETGTWITNSVSTGPVHLGDLHSIGSAGENVVFFNEDSQIAWHPSWGGVTTDGLNVFDQTVRKHGDTLLFTEPSGFTGNIAVGYNSTFTTTSNKVLFFLQIIPLEDYIGDVTLKVTNPITGTEVCSFILNIAAANDTQMVVPLKYPLWLPTQHDYTMSITKEDGQLLQVRSTVGGVEPWWRMVSREYRDHPVLHEGNPENIVALLSAMTGAGRLSASAIRDFPLMTSTLTGVAKLGATMTIDGEGRLNTSVSPTSIKIVSDQAARLLIPISGGATLSIQQDSGFTYGIEAELDTSVDSNWKQIGVVATNVVSFNGRNGAVSPSIGDYNQKQISTVNDDSGIAGFFGINNIGIYWDDGV